MPGKNSRMLFVDLPVRDLNEPMAFFSNLGFEYNPKFTDVAGESPAPLRTTVRESNRIPFPAMNALYLAQFNVARMRGALEDPVMSGFVARLDEINALADGSPGFVWRLQTDAGNATYLRPYGDDRIIVNMSVWESAEALRAFVYRGDHSEILRRRHDWFEKLETPVVVLWWVPAGHVPSIDEGKRRLAHLEAHGPGPFAFTFRALFPPDEDFAKETDWSAFEPCPTA